MSVKRSFATHLIPPDCDPATLLPQSSKYLKSADLLRKSLLSHIWRVPSSKALSCKHERLFDPNWCLRIAPLQGSSRKVSAPRRSVLNVCHWHTAPTNIRNPLIYCVNRCFFMFCGSQVQKPYHASMNGFLTFWPWYHYIIRSFSWTAKIWSNKCTFLPFSCTFSAKYFPLVYMSDFFCYYENSEIL